MAERPTSNPKQVFHHIFIPSFTCTGFLCAFAGNYEALTTNFITGKASIESMSVLVFGPEGILFVGDSRAGKVFAIDLDDRTGQVVPGQLTISNDEKIWSFSPATSWQSGTFQLLISEKLEDLAGNNLLRCSTDPISKETNQNPQKNKP